MGNTICEFIEAPIFEGSSSTGLDLSYNCIKKSIFWQTNSIFTDYVKKIEVNSISDTFFVKNIKAVMNKCENIRLDVLNSLLKKRFPILIGGDHSVAMASIAADSEVFGIDNFAVIYIDGHCDINTEKTSVTHNIHGMPLASSLGLCYSALQVGPLQKKINGDNLYIMGARSIDDPERIIIKDNQVHLYENNDIIYGDLKAILLDIKNKIGDKKVHISFDVDVLDPTILTSTGYVMDNGIQLHTALDIIDFALSNFDVVSADIVEYNPTIDYSKKDLDVVLKIVRHFEKGIAEKAGRV